MDRSDCRIRGCRCCGQRSWRGHGRWECVIAAASAARRRTCIGCRRARPVDGLVRIAFVGDRLQTGRTLPGRGAWICASDRACLQRAATPDRLRHAFRRDIQPGVAEHLIAALQSNRGGAEPFAVPR